MVWYLISHGISLILRIARREVFEKKWKKQRMAVAAVEIVGEGYFTVFDLIKCIFNKVGVFSSEMYKCFNNYENSGDYY